MFKFNDDLFNKRRANTDNYYATNSHENESDNDSYSPSNQFLSSAQVQASSDYNFYDNENYSIEEPTEIYENNLSVFAGPKAHTGNNFKVNDLNSSLRSIQEIRTF